MDQITPPPELNNYLQGEKPDFTVQSKRTSPVSNGLLFLLGGILIIFALGFVAVPFLSGQDITLTVNKIPITGNIHNIQPIIGPVIGMGFFSLLAIFCLIFGIINLIPNPAWYTGTSTGLAIFQKNKNRLIDWKQFNGNLEVKGGEEKQSLIMELRTGRFRRDKHGRQYFQPERILIIGINNTGHIENILRQRIKENNPTPAQIL